MIKIQYTPSERDIEAAKKYLIERLGAERSMSNNLQRAMKRAAIRIVEIAYSYNTIPENFSFSNNRAMEREIDAVIADLIEEVLDYTEVLSTYPCKEDKDDILAFIFRENYGMTFDERLKDYAHKYKRELEIGILAALLLNKKRDEAINAIKDNLRHPFENPYVAQARSQGKQIDIPKYGRGRTNSMQTAITNLTSFAVAEGWMRWLWIDAKNKGAIGFVTYRGSTYPCDMCDEYAGWIHPMDDRMPPLHSHCVCGAIFVYMQ